MTSYQLPVTSYQLSVISHQSPVISYQLNIIMIIVSALFFKTRCIIKFKFKFYDFYIY